MSIARLLLVTDAVGGVWVYSLELARALKPLGVETTLAVMGPAPSARQREQAAGFKLIDTGLPLDWLETNAAELRRAGERIAEVAAREGADLVQTNSAALLAGVQSELPWVVVQHSCVASWWAAVRGTDLPPEFAWRTELVRDGLNRAAAVVAPSAAFAAETARIYDVPVRTVLNGRAIPSRRELPQGDFVLTAGRLWDDGKNVATLDRAAALISAPVQAAGPLNGPNGAKIELSNAIPLGELSEARLCGLFAARPIYASAALYEPFGLSVLEAAQAGCALILSDIPTHRELWGAAAIFVEPRDHQGFARAAQRLLNDRQERQRRGELAKSRAAEFTPERMAAGMARIYAEATKSRPQPLALAGAA